VKASALLTGSYEGGDRAGRRAVPGDSGPIRACHGTWTSAFARGVSDVTLELATAETEVAPAAEAQAAEAPAAEAPAAAAGGRGDRLSSGILCEGEHDQRVTAVGWLARIPGDWLSGRALP
jgi:hypothetical protein